MIDFTPHDNSITINGVLFYIKPCEWLIDALEQVIKHLHLIQDRYLMELSTVTGQSVMSLTMTPLNIEALYSKLFSQYGLTATDLEGGFILDRFSDIKHRKFVLNWVIQNCL